MTRLRIDWEAGAEFEWLVSLIIAKTLPGSDVTRRARVLDCETGKTRVVDLLVKRAGNQTLSGRPDLIVECKEVGRPVGIGIIESAAAQRRAFDISEFWVVSRTPFTEGAKLKASALSVGLRRLVTVDWMGNGYVRGPVAVSRGKRIALFFRPKGKSRSGTQISGNIELFGPKEEVAGRLFGLVAEAVESLRRDSDLQPRQAFSIASGLKFFPLCKGPLQVEECVFWFEEYEVEQTAFPMLSLPFQTHQWLDPLSGMSQQIEGHELIPFQIQSGGPKGISSSFRQKPSNVSFYGWGWGTFRSEGGSLQGESTSGMRTSCGKEHTR